MRMDESRSLILYIDLSIWEARKRQQAIIKAKNEIYNWLERKMKESQNWVIKLCSIDQFVPIFCGIDFFQVQK